MVKALSITDPFLFIHFVSLVLATIGAGLVLGELQTPIPLPGPFVFIPPIYSPMYRWSALACAIVTWMNFAAYWIEQSEIIVFAGGIVWWASPSVITLFFYGFVSGPLLVLLGTIASFSSYLVELSKSILGRLEYKPAETEEQASSESSPEAPPAPPSVSTTIFSLVHAYVSRAALACYAVAFVILLVQIIRFFKETQRDAILGIYDGLVDRWIFVAFQSLLAAVLILASIFGIYFSEIFMMVLLGYFATSSLGFTVREVSMFGVAVAGGVFLFIAVILQLAHVLHGRIAPIALVIRFFQTWRDNLVFIASIVLSVIGFSMFIAGFGNGTSVWIAIASVLIIFTNLIASVSEKSEFFWLALGASLHTVPDTLFTIYWRGSGVGVAGGCILIIATITSFVSMRNCIKINVYGAPHIFLTPVGIILALSIVGAVVSTSFYQVLQTILISSLFVFHAYLDVDNTQTTALFFTGIIFSSSIQYWSPMDNVNGVPAGTAFVALGYLLMSIGMLGIMVYRVKLLGKLGLGSSGNDSERQPLAASQSGGAYSAPADASAPEGSVSLFSDDLRVDLTNDSEVSPRETYVDI